MASVDLKSLTGNELLALIEEAGSKAALAKEIGVCHTTINNHAKRLGVFYDEKKAGGPRPARIRREVVDLTKADLARLFEEHGSSYKVADALGVSQGTIQRTKIRLGFEFDGRLSLDKKEKPEPSKETIRLRDNLKRLKALSRDEFLSQLDEAGSMDRLGARYGVSGSTIARNKASLGIKESIRSLGIGRWYRSERGSAGQKNKRYRDCEICGTEFYAYRKTMRFCGRPCSAVYMSKLYSDGRLCGENNPNFGNGDKVRKRWEEGVYNERPTPNHVRAKGGRFKGVYLKSSWELQFAQDLCDAGLPLLYEKTRFVLKDGRHYTPDFQIDATLIEIKGFWYPKSLKKFRVFRDEYPLIEVIVLGEEWWKTRQSLSVSERCSLDVLRGLHEEPS